MSTLKGTGIAIITPFKKDHSIDFQAIENLVQHWINGGTDYLVVMGTTGESVTLDEAEKKEVLDCVAGAVNGKIPLVYGIGGNHTAELLKKLEHFSHPAVEAILSVTPYYNKPGQAGLKAHYSALAQVSPLPLLLYNVPGRTGIHMQPQTVLELAEKHENIIGVKEASGQMEAIMQLLRDRRPDFLVISGDDGITLPLMAAGADGVISVIANAFPAPFALMVKACINHEYQIARSIHYHLFELIRLLFAETSPGGVKAAMAYMGLCENVVRLPLVPVSAELQKKIEKQVDLIQMQYA